MNGSHIAISRRTGVRAAPLIGGAALIGAPARHGIAMPSRVLPHRADALVDSFGVCVHLHYARDVYDDYERVARWLVRLGVRHVRTRLSPQRYVLDRMANLAFDHRIRVQGVCGAFGEDQTMGSVMQAVRRRFASPGQVFSAFEGINEPNNNGRPWVAETRAKTAALFYSRRAFGLKPIPIVAPALARVGRGGVEGATTYQQAGRLGDLTWAVDYGNMHVYPRGLPPSRDIGYFRACSRRVSGAAPIMCTEGGYFNAMGFRGGANPVPEVVAAAYAPQQILTHFQAGTLRFFRYELLNATRPSAVDREGTLGMVRTGRYWIPKPEFGPVQHLLAALRDPGPWFQPRPVELALVNKPWNFRSLVFGKRDGTTVIAMWQDRALWDPRRRRPLVPNFTWPLVPVDLVLGVRRRVEIQHLTTLGVSRVERSTRWARIGLTPGVTLVTIS